MFWRKQKPTPKKYYIPEESLREYYELVDRYYAAPWNQRGVAALCLWRFVKKVTGADVDRGRWGLSGLVLRPYVVRTDT